MTRGDNWPYVCMAHPRPDQTQPADDVRRDVLAIAIAIATLIWIVFMASLVPA